MDQLKNPDVADAETGKPDGSDRVGELLYYALWIYFCACPNNRIAFSDEEEVVEPYSKPEIQEPDPEAERVNDLLAELAVALENYYGDGWTRIVIFHSTYLEESDNEVKDSHESDGLIEDKEEISKITLEEFIYCALWVYFCARPDDRLVIFHEDEAVEPDSQPEVQEPDPISARVNDILAKLRSALRSYYGDDKTRIVIFRPPLNEEDNVKEVDIEETL